MDEPLPAHSVRDNRGSQSFELVVDDRVIGVLEYREFGDHVVMPHTVIDPAHRGRGWGEVLVKAALEDVRSRGKRVIPQCWFVADYIELHPEFETLVL